MTFLISKIVTRYIISVSGPCDLQFSIVFLLRLILPAPATLTSIFSQDVVQYPVRDPVGQILYPGQWIEVWDVELPQVVLRSLRQREAGPEPRKIISN